MSALNIAAYGEGLMYSPCLGPHIPSLQQAGWTTLILGMFHIDSSGNIGFNNTKLVENAAYIGDKNWPDQLSQLLDSGSQITQIEASIGGGGVSDFLNIQSIYRSNNDSFDGTPLKQNFQVFFQTFPMITLIDMDCEDNYDHDSFVAFGNMLIEIGFGITFCPYTNDSFWTKSLASIETQNPGAVKWWNLQCYSGGGGNDPQTWAGYITTVIPSFDTTGYILASDWSRNWNSVLDCWQGDCPPAVTQLMSGYKGEPSVGGAFIWTVDQILNYASVSQQHPDPQSCGTITMTDYVKALQTGLGGT